MTTEVREPSTRSAAEARRDQLLDIARKVIETEGVEALRPTRVAELAGCTRPLIYQYFPRREDIFIAITEELYAALAGGPDSPATVVQRAAQGDTEPALGVVRRLWDYIDRRGPAALILRSTPEISSEFAIYLRSMRDSHDQAWLEACLALGMDAERAQLVVEMFVSIMKVLAMQHLEGRIDRSTAMERHVRAAAAMVEGARAAQPMPEPSSHDASFA